MCVFFSKQFLKRNQKSVFSFKQHPLSIFREEEKIGQVLAYPYIPIGGEQKQIKIQTQENFLFFFGFIHPTKGSKLRNIWTCIPLKYCP